jgi:hypothetical protein
MEQRGWREGEDVLRKVEVGYWQNDAVVSKPDVNEWSWGVIMVFSVSLQGAGRQTRAGWRRC